MDIEALRNDPCFFLNQLSEEDQMVYLQQLYGSIDDFVYTSEEWPESNFLIMKDYTPWLWGLTDFKQQATWTVIASRLIEYYGSELWAKLGMYLKFFKISYIQVLRYRKYESFAAFRRVFPFGCFARHKSLIVLSKEQQHLKMVQWVMGTGGIELVIDCFRYSKTDQQLILRALPPEFYSFLAMMDILRALMHEWAIPEQRCNIQSLIDLLSQKRGVDDHHKYLVMLKPGYPFVINAPKWTRQLHGDITTKLFHQQTKTILLMSKFRPDNFPIIRDLLDILLTYLFRANVDFLREQFEKSVAAALV